jgi:hypothetical protein
MIRYLNTKSNGATETVDQVDSKDFKAFRLFRKYQRYLIGEYQLAGGHGDLYWSQRGCK